MTGHPRTLTGAPSSRALVIAATALVLFSLPYVRSHVAALSPTMETGSFLDPSFLASTEIAEARASMAAGFGPAAVASNGTWTDVEPTLTSLPEFTYDGADGYLLVFQGLVSQAWNSTWIYTHGNWTQLNESAAPTNRFGASIAYDPADGEDVLFGGFTGNTYSNAPLNDTWTFRGGNWSELPAAATGAPSPRAYAAMTYDGQTGQLVLYGGYNSNNCWKSCGVSVLDDTWTFGKGVWHRVHTGAGTPPRTEGAGMAYDPASGNVTMFGGFYENYTLYSNASHPHPIREWSSYPRNETWSYRGGTWRQVTGPGPASESSALVYVPALNGTILFGNTTEGTWKFTNNTWTRLSVAAPPPGGPFAYDAALGEVARFGVTVSTFNGANWTTPVNPFSPPNPDQPLLTYDSGDGYVISYNSGLSQTWIFRNGTWSDISATTGKYLPVFRGGATITYDAADNETILFGGIGWKFVPNTGAKYFPLNDTWALRNGRWTNLHLTHSPPSPNYSASAAYDSHDKEVILFGGRDWTRPLHCFCLGPYRNQTWAFSGGNWTELNSTGAVPPARDNFELVDDPAAGGLLMFGGEESSPTFTGAGNDTWLFSAGNWTRLSTPIAPSRREAASMTYDPSKGEVLLFGGSSSSCYSYCGGYSTSQVWAFDNGSWSLLHFGSQFLPEARVNAGFIYVPQGRYDMLFGGSGPIAVDDVWTLTLS